MQQTASLTPETLAELRRLMGGATPEPWLVIEDQVFGAPAETDDAADDLPLVAAFDLLLWREGMPTPCYADAALIVAMRNALPALLAAAEREQRLRALMLQSAPNQDTETPCWCSDLWQPGHSPYCRDLRALLTGEASND